MSTEAMKKYNQLVGSKETQKEMSLPGCKNRDHVIFARQDICNGFEKIDIGHFQIGVEVMACFEVALRSPFRYRHRIYRPEDILNQQILIFSHGRATLAVYWRSKRTF